MQSVHTQAIALQADLDDIEARISRAAFSLSHEMFESQPLPPRWPSSPTLWSCLLKGHDEVCGHSTHASKCSGLAVAVHDAHSTDS
eukprot:3877634-Amphidinium_carterae.2